MCIDAVEAKKRGVQKVVYYVNAHYLYSPYSLSEVYLTFFEYHNNCHMLMIKIGLQTEKITIFYVQIFLILQSFYIPLILKAYV